MASLATPETSTQEKPHEPSAAITADQVRRAATQQPIGSPQPSIEPVARRPNTDLPKPDMLAALPDVLPGSEVSLVEVQPVIEPGGARDGDAILAQGPQATNDSDTPRKQKAAEIDSTASIPSPASAASAGADNAQPARIVFNPAPAYPPEALAARQTGRVVVRVTVTVEGTVKQARLHRSSGIASLDAAALAAVRNWRFQPAMLDGLRVERDLAVPVRFTLAAQ